MGDEVHRAVDISIYEQSEDQSPHFSGFGGACHHLLKGVFAQTGLPTSVEEAIESSEFKDFFDQLPFFVGLDGADDLRWVRMNSPMIKTGQKWKNTPELVSWARGWMAWGAREAAVASYTVLSSTGYNS